MSEIETVYVREIVATYKRGRKLKAAAAICASRELAAFARKVIPDGPQESFLAVAVDNQNRPVGWAIIGTGNVSGCPVDVGAVMRFALLAGAAALCFAHNHPSGSGTPSAEDMALTARLEQASELMGLRVLDHVILPSGDPGHFSFLDAGLMGWQPPRFPGA